MNIGKNIRKLREGKNMTQEQLGKALKVSYQAVSKWENETTLPDTALLPELARVLDVLVDDLFRDELNNYPNYASRLGTIYANTGELSDFVRAVEEYKRLIQSGKQTSEDLDSLARMYCEHMDNCKDNALKLYNQILEDESQNKGETYYEAAVGRMCILIDSGEGEQMIQECLERVEAEPEVVENYNLLIGAYMWTKYYKKSLEVAEATIEKFPDKSYAYGRAADLYKLDGRYEEAFAYWDKEFELCPRWVHSLYSKAFCYQKLGRKQEELKQWREIVAWLEARNAYIETAMPKENIRRLEQEGIREQ